MTTKTLTPQQKFEERIADRLKDDIGILIPDDVLSDLIGKQIDKIFNQKKHIPKPNRSSYSNETIEVLNSFHEQVLKLLEPRIEKSIEQYFKDNEKDINDRIDGAIKVAANKAFSSLVRGAVKEISGGIIQGASHSLERAMMVHQNDYRHQ